MFVFQLGNMGVAKKAQPAKKDSVAPVAAKPPQQGFLDDAGKEVLVTKTLYILQDLAAKEGKGDYKTSLASANKAIDELVKQDLITKENKDKMLAEFKAGNYANAVAILGFDRSADLAIKIYSAYLDDSKLVDNYNGNYYAAAYYNRGDAYKEKKDYANAITDFKAAQKIRLTYNEKDKASRCQERINECDSLLKTGAPAKPATQSPKPLNAPPAQAGGSKKLDEAKAALSDEDRLINGAYAELQHLLALQGEIKAAQKQSLKDKLQAQYASERKRVDATLGKLFDAGLDEFGQKDGESSYTNSDGLKEYLKKGDYKGIMGDIVSRIYKNWNKPSDQYALEGKCYYYLYTKKDPQAALKFANQEVALAMNHRAYANRADVYAELGDYDNAIADRTRIIGLEPTNAANNYDVRGDFYFKAGKFAEALADYKMAKKLDPSDSTYTDDIKKATDAIANAGKPAAPASQPATQQTQAKPPASKGAPVLASVTPATGTQKVNIKSVVKKQVLPISKLDGFYDRELDRLANLTGKEVDDLSDTYTEEEVNRAFKGVGDYVAKQSGGKVLPLDWETRLIGGELTLSKQQLAIVESVCALWLGRTDAYAKKSFDDVLSKGDVNAALLAIYDSKAGKSSIASDMSYDGSRVSAGSARYWQEVVFKPIMDGVPLAEKVAEKPKQPEKVVEVPGTLDKYSDLEAFKQDWRVVSAAKLFGTIDYQKYSRSGKYLVDGVMSEVAAAMEERQTAVESKNKLICDRIEMITGKLNNDATKVIGGITNDVDGAVLSGALWEGSSRADLKKAHPDAKGAIFESDGKHYALSTDYIEKEGVKDALVKTEGRKLAKAPLDVENAQDFIRGKLAADLKLFGEYSYSGSAPIRDYLAGKSGLTPEARMDIAVTAEVNSMASYGQSTFAEFISPDVTEAIKGKKLDNAGTLALVGAINSDARLKENGLFVESKVMQAIDDYAAPALAGQKANALQEETPKQPGKAMGSLQFGNELGQRLRRNMARAAGLDQYTQIGNGSAPSGTQQGAEKKAAKQEERPKETVAAKQGTGQATADDLLLAGAVSQLDSLVKLINANGDAKQIEGAKAQVAKTMESVYGFSDYFGPKNVGEVRLRELMGKGDYEHALVVVNSININWNNAANPELADKKFNYYLFVKDDTQNAMKIANAAIDAEKSSHSYVNRAMVYESLKDYDKAIADMSAAISLEPTYEFYFKDRGDLYFAAGKYAEALADYNKAKQMDPKGAYDVVIKQAQDALDKQGGNPKQPEENAVKQVETPAARPKGEKKQKAEKTAQPSAYQDVQASRPLLYGLLENNYDDVVKAVMANGAGVIGTRQDAADAIGLFVKDKAYNDSMFDDTNDAAKWANRISPYYQASLLK